MESLLNLINGKSVREEHSQEKQAKGEGRREGREERREERGRKAGREMAGTPQAKVGKNLRVSRFHCCHPFY